MAAAAAPASANDALPRGVVLGPDGKPCKICTSSRDWKAMAKMTAQRNASNSQTGQKPSPAVIATTSSTFGAATASTPSQPSPPAPTDCPPDVEALGRATWTFLHTTAAYYPEQPTMPQRVHMLGLLNALPSLYPCSHCASHLASNVKDHPPDVRSRGALSRWLCARHNDVNQRLGKAAFDCSLKNLDERWKDGPSSGACDE